MAAAERTWEEVHRMRESFSADVEAPKLSIVESIDLASASLGDGLSCANRGSL